MLPGVGDALVQGAVFVEFHEGHHSFMQEIGLLQFLPFLGEEIGHIPQKHQAALDVFQLGLLALLSGHLHKLHDEVHVFRQQDGHLHVIGAVDHAHEGFDYGILHGLSIVGIAD